MDGAEYDPYVAYQPLDSKAQRRSSWRLPQLSVLVSVAALLVAVFAVVRAPVAMAERASGDGGREQPRQGPGWPRRGRGRLNEAPRG